MKILVVNCGSSSLKYQLFEMGAAERVLARGLMERIGTRESTITHHVNGEARTLTEAIADHRTGVRRMLELLAHEGEPPPLPDARALAGVGHRLVHGGEDFSESVLVDERVIACVERCCELAPLHNPANLSGLRAMMEVLPDIPQVGVFDTAFQQTMDPVSYIYAVPYEWYEQHRVRRYGFHGTSHRYVAQQAAGLLGIERPNLITLHLGNGASATAIRAGRAIDQSMGFTPLEGLVMGTRCGDIDPAIIFHMVRQGLSLDDVRHKLEKASGLLGVSGVSNDMRDVLAAAGRGNKRAELALGVYAHRVRRYIGAYLLELGRCDAIVFTGGVGENAAPMRARILAGLEASGIELDARRNEAESREARAISRPDSRVAVWVIPTNEELMIARDTRQLVQRA